MKTLRLSLPLTVAALALAATSLLAGPGPQYWIRPTTVATAKEVAPAQADTKASMACVACKTVAINRFESASPNGRPPMKWTQVGTKHECAHCGGAITVVNGKTTDAMPQNCTMCAPATTSCCKLPTPTQKT